MPHPHRPTPHRASFFAGLVLMLVTLSACSQVALFNGFVPKDGGVRQVASNLAYGEGPRQRLDLYAPSALPAEGSLPVILFLYGGSWKEGDKDSYSFVARAFAARGYLVAVADYRLVPGVRYPAFVEDGAAALAFLHNQAGDYGGDPDRLYLVGHSAGAYNVMMLATAAPFLKAQGKSTSIIRAVAGLSGPYDFLPLDVEATREAFKGVEDLPATQPVNRVRGNAPPAFLAHGEADDLVFPRNTRALAKAYRAAGAGVEARYYEGVDHAGTLLALSKPLRDKAPVLDEVLAFFARHGSGV